MKKFVVLTIVGLLIFGTIGIIAGSKVLKAQDEPIWPMFGFNAQRTNQCPYDASNNNGIWKWRYKLSDYRYYRIYGFPVIGADNTLYVVYNGSLYALNPNGTLKWEYGTGSYSTTPAIAKDGTIYVEGGNNFYAINPDGTLKWKLALPSGYFSPTSITKDGTIYVEGGNNFYAINPDGTLKWKFSGEFNSTNQAANFAVSDDGTIYAAGEEYLYVLNPDGTLKHQWNIVVSSGPVIGPNGTIYVIFSSDRSLMAFSPDGILKWKYGDRGYFNSLPAIAKDGTIYVSGNGFCAINPDGTLKWEMQNIGGTPIVGKDGTIYVGGGNNFYAINPDGTLKHKISLHYMSRNIDYFNSVILDNNGMIYACCSDGYLYAIGNPDVTLPTTPQNLKIERASAALKLTWDASTKGTYPIAGYAIYRSIDGGKHFSFLDTTVDTSTTYTDYSVNTDATYYYYVTAFDNRTPPDESEPSDIVSMGPPDFSISVNPTEQTINQGNSATFTVTLTSMFGFNSEVTLSALSMPYGVTAKFDPETLTPTESGVTSTLTLTVSDTAPTGNFNINIKGTSDSKTHYANIALTITNTGIKKGDVNQDGKITAQDAILVLRYHAGYITLTEKQLSAADMNNDGKVDETDAQLILKKAVGL